MRLTTKKVLKMFHTLGAIGMAGGLAGYMMIVSVAPEIGATDAYLSVRQLLEQLSSWLILPSMTVVLLSGVISMAVHFPFQNAGWVWAKLLVGLLILESMLATVDGPAQRATHAVQQAIVGDLAESELPGLIADRWGAWWILLTIAGLNVVVAVWRPRFGK